MQPPRRAQSAVEFVSTYSFVFLIIAIVLVLLFALSYVPSKSISFQCNSYGGFSCIDVSYTNASGSAQLVVELSDAQPGIVSISSFSAKISGAATAKGSCAPSIVTAGSNVICTAKFSRAPAIGITYIGTFNVSANYCNNGIGNISNTTCKAGSSYIFGGSIVVQGSPPTTLAYLYCVGGYTTGSASNAYYAPVTVNGPLGAWSSTTSYPQAAGEVQCSLLGGYVYCGGVYNYNNNAVYYAPVSSTGIGTWISTTVYPMPTTGPPTGLDEAACAQYNGYIYCGTPYNVNNFYYAPLLSSGVGTWTSTTSYPISNYAATCSAYKGYIYCVGGAGTGAPTAVYYAPLSSTGIGTWISTTSLPAGINYDSCPIYTGYIYCLGSTFQNPNSYVYYAAVSSGGVGNWIAGTSYPSNDYSTGCAIYNGYIYCVGGGTASAPTASLNNVYYAPVTGTGIGSWTSTTAYPVATQLLDGDCFVKSQVPV